MCMPSVVAKRWQNNGASSLARLPPSSSSNVRRARRDYFSFSDGCANSPPTNELSFVVFFAAWAASRIQTRAHAHWCNFIYSKILAHTRKTRQDVAHDDDDGLEYMWHQPLSQKAQKRRCSVTLKWNSGVTLGKWKNHLNHWIWNLFSPKFKYNLHHCTTNRHAQTVTIHAIHSASIFDRLWQKVARDYSVSCVFMSVPRARK